VQKVSLSGETFQFRAFLSKFTQSFLKAKRLKLQQTFPLLAPNGAAYKWARVQIY
jgi:hypothetical protein